MQLQILWHDCAQYVECPIREFRILEPKFLGFVPFYMNNLDH